MNEFEILLLICIWLLSAYLVFDLGSTTGNFIIDRDKLNIRKYSASDFLYCSLLYQPWFVLISIICGPLMLLGTFLFYLDERYFKVKK